VRYEYRKFGTNKRHGARIVKLLDKLAEQEAYLDNVDFADFVVALKDTQTIGEIFLLPAASRRLFIITDEVKGEWADEGEEDDRAERTDGNLQRGHMSKTDARTIQTQTHASAGLP